MQNPDINIRVLRRDDVYRDGSTAMDTVGCHDLIFIPEFLCPQDDFTIYNKMAEEIEYLKTTGTMNPNHQKTHMIADNKTGWSSESPLFEAIVSVISERCNITPKASRLNFYRSNGEETDHNPYHHDRVMFNEHSPQNVTISVSLGVTRGLTFKQSQRKSPGGSWETVGASGPKVNLNCTNGSLYLFARDVNVEWVHGIAPGYVSPDERDRICVTVWGQTNLPMDVHGSRVSERPNAVPTSDELGPAAYAFPTRPRTRQDR